MVDLLANSRVERIFLCAAAYHFLGEDVAEDVALNLQIAYSFLAAGYKTVKLRMVEERRKPDPYEDPWLFLLAITELWKNK